MSIFLSAEDRIRQPALYYGVKSLNSFSRGFLSSFLSLPIRTAEIRTYSKRVTNRYPYLSLPNRSTRVFSRHVYAITQGAYVCNYCNVLKRSFADRCANLAIHGQVTYEPRLKIKTQMHGYKFCCL